MAKNKISEWSATPANNTDVGGIDIAEGCAPSGINNAIREMMAQIKDMQAGTDGDNFTIGGNLTVTGTTTLSTDLAITDGGTGASTASGARTNLGLGSIATQDSTAVAITGGSITGITDLAVADGGTGASSITANSVILGNGTSALSGNLVAPGTSGNVLTSNGTTWTSAAAPDMGIGVSQTWQNVTSSRSTGTVYQNTTGKPIMVAISMYSSNQLAYFYIGTTSSPSVVSNFGASSFTIYGNVSFIIPNDHYYKVSGGSSIAYWMELR